MTKYMFLLVAFLCICMGKAHAQIPDPGEQIDGPDRAIGFRLPTNDLGECRIVTSSIQILEEAAFGRLELSEDGGEIAFLPFYSQIEYDRFSFMGTLENGDLFVVEAEYSGTEKNARVSAFMLDASKPDDIHWHHELPQNIFGDKSDWKGKFPGIDQQYINQKEFGVLFFSKDHLNTGGIHHPIDEDAYNKQWKDWVEKYRQKNNGKFPGKEAVLKQLEVFRTKYNNIYKRGLRSMWNYGAEWRAARKKFLDRIRARLSKKAQRLARKAGEKLERRVGKQGSRWTKRIPLLGPLIVLGCSGTRVYGGETIKDVATDEVLDVTPVVGIAKGAYETGQLIGDIGFYLLQPSLAIGNPKEELWSELQGLLQPADDSTILDEGRKEYFDTLKKLEELGKKLAENGYPPKESWPLEDRQLLDKWRVINFPNMTPAEIEAYFEAGLDKNPLLGTRNPTPGERKLFDNPNLLLEHVLPKLHQD